MHICACIASSRYRHNHVTGTLFRCPKCVRVSNIYCISLKGQIKTKKKDKLINLQKTARFVSDSKKKISEIVRNVSKIKMKVRKEEC